MTDEVDSGSRNDSLAGKASAVGEFPHVEWGFRTGSDDDPRSGGNPEEYAMGAEIGTFVRETLQNSNDEWLEGADPVDVTYKIVDLSGEELKEFKRALGWDQLYDHVSAAAETENGSGIKRYMDHVERTGTLRMLVVEDKHTTGLTGREGADNTKYTALTRDVLESDKDGTSSGRFGLGKAVLWGLSGFKTVLFNSVLNEDPEDSEKISPRVVGRARLPWYRLPEEDELYLGAGWYGHETGGSHPHSVWGDTASRLADALKLSRPDLSGTSIGVVGFHDPTAATQPTPEELAQTLIDEAIGSFWPALYSDRLEVSVELPDGSEMEADPSESSEVAPFIEIMDDPTDLDETLESPGDVVAETITVELPDRELEDGRIRETTDGEVRLFVREARPDEEFQQNTVAMYRANGMVVNYRNLGRYLYTDRDFHAVLVCGEARGTLEGSVTQGDEDVDDFLADAEPPRHDDWRVTEELAENYLSGHHKGQIGYSKALKELKDEVKKTVERLFAPDFERGEPGPESLGNRFEIGNGPKPPKEAPLVWEWRRVDFDRTREKWDFDAAITPTEDSHDGWTGTVQLKRMSEERATEDTIPIETVKTTTEGARASKSGDDYELQADPGTDTVEFRGSSVLDPREVETRLLLRAQVRTGGDES